MQGMQFYLASQEPTFGTSRVPAVSRAVLDLFGELSGRMFCRKLLS